MKGHNPCPLCNAMKPAFQTRCSPCKAGQKKASSFAKFVEAAKKIDEATSYAASVSQQPPPTKLTPAQQCAKFGHTFGPKYSYKTSFERSCSTCKLYETKNTDGTWGPGPWAPLIPNHKAADDMPSSWGWVESLGYVLKHAGKLTPFQEPVKHDCEKDGHKLSAGNTKVVCSECTYWYAVANHEKDSPAPTPKGCLCEAKFTGHGSMVKTFAHPKCPMHGDGGHTPPKLTHTELMTYVDEIAEKINASTGIPLHMLMMSDSAVAGVGEKAKLLAKQIAKTNSQIVMPVHDEITLGPGTTLPVSMTPLKGPDEDFYPGLEKQLKAKSYPEIPVRLTAEERSMAITNKIAAIKMVRMRFNGPYDKLSESSHAKGVYAMANFPGSGSISSISLIDAKASVDAYLDKIAKQAKTEAASLLLCTACGGPVTSKGTCAVLCQVPYVSKATSVCDGQGHEYHFGKCVTCGFKSPSSKHEINPSWPGVRKFGKMKFCQGYPTGWVIDEENPLGTATTIVRFTQPLPTEEDICLMLCALNASRSS